jgi:hypothetical protein
MSEGSDETTTWAADAVAHVPCASSGQRSPGLGPPQTATSYPAASSAGAHAHASWLSTRIRFLPVHCHSAGAHSVWKNRPTMP